MGTERVSLDRGGPVKSLRAEYGEDGRVKLGGRTTVIHPTWLAQFTKMLPGHIERMARIMIPLRRTLLDLLSLRPIGVVEEEKTSRLLVVSRVDYFCLAVELRFEQISIYRLPDGVDCASIARIDGMLDPLLMAHRSDADHLIRALLRAEQRGHALIARKGLQGNGYPITIEDFAYLLHRDASTVHLKLRGERPRRPPRDRKNVDDATCRNPTSATIPLDEQNSDGKLTPGSAMPSTADSAQSAAPADEPPEIHEAPPVAETPAASTGEIIALVPSLLMRPADAEVSRSVGPQTVTEPPPKRPSPTAKRTRRRLEDELQGCLFPSAEPKVK